MSKAMKRRKAFSVIAKLPPNDGREWDCQCARCGSSCYEFDDGPIRCMSSEDWCLSHPLALRTRVKRGSIEWFTFD